MAYITLDFDAYKHNLEFLASKVGGAEKLMAVLKDNAYGHGLEQMSPLAAACGVKRAVVKDVNEAKKVADFFEKVLILIEANPQNALQDDKLVYACDDLDAISIFPKHTNIHLKVDTGMGRNGVLPSELEEAFLLIKKHELKLEGVFTHFYGADMSGEDFYVQMQTYQQAKKTCKKLAQKFAFQDLIFHSRNSAATLRIKDDFDDDFARVGIASYGYTDIPQSIGEYPLKKVLSLWAEKICTKSLKKGDVVGYGAVFRAKEDMVVSSYDLGYGDGLFRQDGQDNLCVSNGKKILGRMSMDCFSLQGNEQKVCVFDDAFSWAKKHKTISYEILTSLSPFLKRIVKPYATS